MVRSAEADHSEAAMTTPDSFYGWVQARPMEERLELLRIYVEVLKQTRLPAFPPHPWMSQTDDDCPRQEGQN